MDNNTLFVNGREVKIEGERNLLELIRKTGITIPTFCYRSRLSIYGACRLCLVQVEGRGIMASCSTVPEPGMKIETDNKQLRALRKINVELLLANHRRECPSCDRSADCTLQNLARRLGVNEVRFKQREDWHPLDDASPSLVRDPNKCVLCGDCVRACSELQTVGALGFAGRGANARVVPAFDKDLNQVECVNCGQCAAVCPTGAIVPKSDVDNVWKAIHDPSKTVVVQVAPAVRVALGDRFGFEVGDNVDHRMVSALRLMGFDHVYDTSFAADMTIFEEGTELLERITTGGVMPMFTSCCPGWMKFVETFYPEFLPNVSTTRSPQQIFGSVARRVLPKELNVKPENLVIVSIMPCTAKKFEASLPKFQQNGRPDVDYVLTTIEAGQMLESVGIELKKLKPEEFDQPFGMATGGAVIFGATGGVMEAALRFAAEKISGKPLENVEFNNVRGLAPRKEALVVVDGKKLRLAIVHGLGNARALIEDIKAKRAEFDFIEVMACPGGCVAGGGQPITEDEEFRTKRAEGLYRNDKARKFQKPQENTDVEQCYCDHIGGKPGSHTAHDMLHTAYENREMQLDTRMTVLRGDGDNLLRINVRCCTRPESAQGKALLGKLVEMLQKENLAGKVELEASFTIHTDGDGRITIGNTVYPPTASMDWLRQVIAAAVKAN